MNATFHADDYGLSRSNTNQIFKCIKNNCLKSISYMGNGLAIDYAESLITNDFKIDKFLHICLTEGKSLGKNYTLLTDKNSHFKTKFWTFMFHSIFPNLSSSKVLKQEVKREIKLQINKYLEIVSCDQLQIDSHQHIHMTPIILDSILSLKDESKIKLLRLPREYFLWCLPTFKHLNCYFGFNIIKLMLIRLLTSYSIKKINNSNLKFNENFAGLLHSSRMSAKFVIKYSDKFPNSLIIFHPGRIKNEKISNFWKKRKFKKFHHSKWRDYEFNQLHILNQKKEYSKFNEKN